MVVGLLVRLHERPADAGDLGRHQALAQLLARLREKKQALAPVGFTLFPADIALVDQFLEHSRQALFGDPQYVEQLGDCHAGVAAYEMHHPVMGAAEAEFLQDFIRFRDEITVGKEQQFHEAEGFILVGWDYVSHIDIFFRVR